MKKNHTNALLVLWMITSLFACQHKTKPVSEKKAPIQVFAEPVQAQNIVKHLTFNGVTTYHKKETIRSQATGYISWVNYTIGDTIRTGQTFALLRTKEQDALAEAVKIDSSLKQFITPLRIKSNATGIITQRNVSKNDYIAEGDVLAEVVAPNSLVIEVYVPYGFQNVIHLGTPCEIILQNGTSYPAKITGKLPTVNTAAQSQIFLIALPKTALPEQLNVQVKTVFKKANGVKTVPKTALQTDELLSEFWVMKVVNDSMAIKQKVTPLLENDTLVQIQSDAVKINDLVITDGAYQMQDSTRVSIKKP